MVSKDCSANIYGKYNINQMRRWKRVLKRSMLLGNWVLSINKPFNSAIDKQGIKINIFLIFSQNTYVVGTH